MDEITKAHVLRLEQERDDAIEQLAERDLDLQEANESIAILTAQLRIKEQESHYPIEVA